MTKKQAELINNMIDILDTEFDYGLIQKKDTYTHDEVSKLIFLNKDNFYGIIDGGQCTVKQYNKLTAIAGRKPKLERHLIGHFEASQLIKKYSKISA